MGRSLWVAACAVLFVASASAQSGRQTGDPITGKWGSDGKTFLDLQYNNEGVVAGTVVWYGKDSEQRVPVGKGTFDGESGALQLAGEAKNREGKTVQYQITGRLEKGTLSGTYDFGGEKGEFTFTRQ